MSHVNSLNLIVLKGLSVAHGIIEQRIRLYRTEANSLDRMENPRRRGDGNS